MNQRSRNSRRHAAVFIGQLVERGNGHRIAQHHGELPALRAQGSLTLGASLGLGHVSRRRREQFAAVLGMYGLGAIFVQPERHATGIDIHPLPSGCGKHYLRHFRRNVFGIREGGACVHGYLRSGLIPLMCESYTVTSDVSTTISWRFA